MEPNNTSGAKTIIVEISPTPYIPNGGIPGVELNPISRVLDFFTQYHSFKSADSLVTKDRADAFWVHFRLNNKESLTMFPAVSHLNLTGEQMTYMSNPEALEFYTQNVEPLFVKLLKNPNGRIVFLNTMELQFKYILKNDDKFYRLTYAMDPDFENRFNKQILEEMNNGELPLLISGIFYE